jgi:hypothetical protein
MNDPSGLNLSINATGGTLGVVSFAAEGTAVGTAAAVGGVWDGSNFVVNQVLAPMFNAAPRATINADGVTIPNPALMNEGDLVNGR